MATLQALRPLGPRAWLRPDPTSDESTLQTAAASLQSDTQTAQANLPPSCIPNLRQDESAALTDFSKDAIDCDQAVSEMSAGNYTVATQDMQVANGLESAGNTKLAAATADVKAYSNSGG